MDKVIMPEIGPHKIQIKGRSNKIEIFVVAAENNLVFFNFKGRDRGHLLKCHQRDDGRYEWGMIRIETPIVYIPLEMVSWDSDYVYQPGPEVGIEQERKWISVLLNS